MNASLLARLRLTALVAPLMGSAFACSRQPVTTLAGGCVGGSWSDPSPVPAAASGDTALVRYPTIAAGIGGGYVVGNNVRTAARPLSRKRLLQIWSFANEPVPPPAGDFTFMFPRGVVGPSGELTVFWGEPRADLRSTDSVRWMPLLAYGTESVWSATFTPGAGWDTPIKLHQGGVEWNKQLVDRPIVMGGSAVVAVAKSANVDGGILVLAARRGVGSSRELPTGLASQPSIAELDGTAYVAYIAAYQGNRPDENSVFLIATRDGGVSWSAPTLVSRSGSRPANDVRLRAGPDGRLHLIWRQSVEGGRSALRHVSSVDGGATWSTPDDLAPAAGLSLPRAAIDRCARLNVVYENGRASGSLDHVSWDGAWSRVERPFPDMATFDADLAATDSGDLRLVLVAGAANDPESHRSLVAVRRSTVIAR
jgi:hypothetical protein